MLLRHASEADYTEVLRLNEAAVPAVNSLSREDLAALAGQSLYFKVAAQNAQIGAFLLGLGPGVNYKSINYRWFAERYANFVYIDRVVVDAAYRRFGLGRQLYQDFGAMAAKLQTILACEVNLRPRNDVSLTFHTRLGFEIVGEQDTEGGQKRVALMVAQSVSPACEAEEVAGPSG